MSKLWVGFLLAHRIYLKNNREISGMYYRRYAGQLDYIPATDGYYEVETFIIQDESIGFAMTEVVPGSNAGWRISGRASKQGSEYVANNVKFANSGATSLDRTISFTVFEEEPGVLASIHGQIYGLDIPTCHFEGDLEVIK
ncbi:hypothetical protein [Aquabacterium sp.]|uniref:hypothetical protein n=1 Tax=Aquabacterium sp. TaxID=1872578 RepID=UPI0019CA14F5|nr:hypothetical protein [Aquabacterium sp.]MBC7701666.1 hypothetical protein [Aquabacterium sp.]